MNTDVADRRRAYIDSRQSQQKHAVKAYGWITCLNCEHFRDDMCKLYQAVPPPAIIVHGCASYEESIPF